MWLAAPALAAASACVLVPTAGLRCAPGVLLPRVQLPVLPPALFLRPPALPTRATLAVPQRLPGRLLTSAPRVWGMRLH